MVDIICRIIAVISVILWVVLYFYDQHKMIKWIKENSKDEKGDKEE